VKQATIALPHPLPSLPLYPELSSEERKQNSSCRQGRAGWLGVPGPVTALLWICFALRARKSLSIVSYTPLRVLNLFFSIEHPHINFVFLLQLRFSIIIIISSSSSNERAKPEKNKSGSVRGQREREREGEREREREKRALDGRLSNEQKFPRTNRNEMRTAKRVLFFSITRNMN
jgi:hypothetical protein